MIFDNDIGTTAPPALPILVAKWDHPIKAILICQEWVGVRTHWYGGHTIACCGTENCKACEAGQLWVKKLYIAAKSPTSGNSAILMLTPVACSLIRPHLSRSSGCLGCEVVIGRAAKRNTAPMTATVVDYHPSTEDFGLQRLERVIRRIFKENEGLKTD